MKTPTDNANTFITRLMQFSIGPIVSGIISAVSIPILTWLVNPEELGRAAMYTTAQNLISIALFLGLDQAYIREYHEHPLKSTLLNHAFMPPFISSLICSGVMIYLWEPMSNIIYGDSSIYAICVLAISVVFMVLNRYSLLIMRMEESAKKYSYFQISQKALYVIMLFPLVLFVEKSYKMVITANAISLILIAFPQYYFTRSNWKFSVSFDYELLHKLFKFGIPLIGASILAWILNSIDKVALRKWSNFHELGLYANAFQFAAALLIVQQAFATFWAPTSYRWYVQKIDKSRFSFVSQAISFIMTILFLAIAALRNIIKIFIEPSYYPSIDLMPFLMLFPVMYTISETTVMGINFTRKTGYTLLVTGLSAVISVICNYYFVPIWGALGAAVSIGFSFIVYFWLRTLVSNKLWNAIHIKQHIINTVILVLGCLVVFTDWQYTGYTILMIFTLILNRQTIEKIFKMLNIRDLIKNNNQRSM